MAFAVDYSFLFDFLSPHSLTLSEEKMMNSLAVRFIFGCS